jgi:signal transduction histidine kinase
VCLEDQVQTAVADLAALRRQTAATITWENLGVDVLADPLQLSGVMQNLLSNAIKYCGPAPPQVHLWCEADRKDPEYCVVRVRDNGIGIAPEEQEKAFRMFARLERKLAWGTGMGLALCRKIVERHGGRLWVESQVGQGSTFCFTIRLVHPGVQSDV